MHHTHLATILCVLSAPAFAQDGPRLGLPVDCVLGETCFIQQYVDYDPGPGFQDYACEQLSYDGHKGTDFALISHLEMMAGVDVIASAPGKVTGVRDGMRDILYTTDIETEVDGRECGNGVAVDHGHGWTTQYCHMRNGSVSVVEGQNVERGERLGLIGISGKTQFPHVHLSVRHRGNTVDPFNPAGELACEQAPSQSMWIDPPTYKPGGIIATGFSTSLPNFGSISFGDAAISHLSVDAPALVAWGYLYGGQIGDTIKISINGPEGEVSSDITILEKLQAQFFQAAGRRARDGDWARGRYEGTIELLRDGRRVDRMTTILIVK